MEEPDGRILQFAVTGQRSRKRKINPSTGTVNHNGEMYAEHQVPTPCPADLKSPVTKSVADQASNREIRQIIPERKTDDYQLRQLEDSEESEIILTEHFECERKCEFPADKNFSKKVEKSELLGKSGRQNIEEFERDDQGDIHNQRMNKLKNQKEVIMSKQKEVTKRREEQNDERRMNYLEQEVKDDVRRKRETNSKQQENKHNRKKEDKTRQREENDDRVLNKSNQKESEKILRGRKKESSQRKKDDRWRKWKEKKHRRRTDVDKRNEKEGNSTSGKTKGSSCGETKVNEIAKKQ